MACVYKITNKTTGRFYIGSTNNLQRRKKEHFGGIMDLFAVKIRKKKQIIGL